MELEKIEALIAKLEQLAEAATPGPHTTSDMVLGGWQTIEDGEYHALAINSLPSLLAEYRLLLTVAEAARECYEAYIKGHNSGRVFDTIPGIGAALAALDAPR